MIYENIYIGSYTVGVHSFPKGSVIKKIIQSIKNTFPDFLNALQDKTNINEDELSQVFVKQNQIHIQLIGLTSYYVGVQYRDIYHKTKGIPDIHYSPNEKGRDNKAIFVMEAKVLSDPPLSKKREKEYVIGKTQSGNPNGGIERFKLEKHGYDIQECGMLGYIKNHDYNYWFSKVNNWIIEQSLLDANWKKEEILSIIKDNYHQSTVFRKSNKLILHHLWIKL